MTASWLTHLEALAICFASSGVILLLAFYFIVRSSSSADDEPIAMAEDVAPKPVDLETLRLEGFEVIEVYDDVEQWGTVRLQRDQLPAERIVRSVKVRDPQTGAVYLMKVHTLVKPW